MTRRMHYAFAALFAATALVDFGCALTMHGRVYAIFFGVYSGICTAFAFFAARRAS